MRSPTSARCTPAWRRASSPIAGSSRGARVVTFANGMVARELIVDVDAERRRVAWAVVGGRLSHHNASAQVFADASGATRFVWIADFLPDEHAPQRSRP